MRWASVAVALAALNTTLTFSNVWPTLAVRLNTGLSVELAFLVLALVLARRWGGPLSPSAQRWLSVLWVILIIGRYADVTVRSLYGREVNLYWDVQFAPDVGAMFAFVAERWQTTAFALGMLLVPLLLWIVPALDARMAAVRFAEPVTPAYARAMGELAYEMTGAGVKALGPAPSLDSNLSRVSGADVFLIFVESYGAACWDRPEFAQALAESRARLLTDIHETRRSVVSALVESTTFGGESWLAHLSLMSGTEVRDHRTNLRLMAQKRDTLAK